VQLNRTFQFGLLVLLLLLACNLIAQQTTARRPLRDRRPNQPWAVSVLVDGYYVPGEQGYADPIVTADRSWLHLEGRYNYEDLYTGSLWLGYNFNLNPIKNVELTITPMVGGVFGRTTGVAPGGELSLAYQKFNLWVSNEYVFDTKNSSGSYYYAWPQLTYSPKDWLHLGLVAQRTLAVESDTQGGFLFGLSAKKLEFTNYFLDPGPKPTVILELGYNF
jgi:hypothetical protein